MRPPLNFIKKCYYLKFVPFAGSNGGAMPSYSSSGRGASRDPRDPRMRSASNNGMPGGGGPPRGRGGRR